MRWQDWMNPLLGVWLIIAPLIMIYEGGYGGLPAWNSYIVGIGLIVVPLTGLKTPAPWREWVVLALGLWLLLAPFLFGFFGHPIATWNMMITGVIVLIATVARLKAIGKGPRGA